MKLHSAWNHLAGLVLRASLLAYPRKIRRQDGRVLVQLAWDLSGDEPSALLREAGSLIVDGIRQRHMHSLGYRDSHWWNKGLVSVAAPFALCLTCLFAAYLGVLLGQWGIWTADFPGRSVAWAVFALFLGAATVRAVHRGKRRAAIALSSLLLMFMAVPAAAEWAPGYGAMWSGVLLTAKHTGVALDVFVMFLPMAILLPFCAARIEQPVRLVPKGRPPMARASTCVLALAAVACLLLGMAPLFVPSLRHCTPTWGDLFGGAAIFLLAAWVLIAVVIAVVFRRPVAVRVAVLLMAASSFVAVWLVPAFVFPPAAEVVLRGLSARVGVAAPLVFYALAGVALALCAFLVLRMGRHRGRGSSAED